MTKRLILTLSILLFSLTSQAAKVALDVVVADEVAVLSETSNLLERLFKEQRPDVEFRKVVVTSPNPFLPKPKGYNEKLRASIKEQMAHILNPGDELEYLIIDTHGESKKEKDGIVYTKLTSLGDFSEVTVDQDFKEVFDFVKPFARKDLKFIMNACLVFNSEEPANIKRAEALLNYFNAPEGSVYGSLTPEADTFMFKSQYANVKNYLPSKRQAITHAVFGIVLGTALALAGEGNSSLEYTKMFATGFMSVQVMHIVRPLMAKMHELLKNVNVGYLFVFKKGKIYSSEFIQKMKDLNKSFVLNKTPSGSAAKLCKQVHTPSIF